MEQVKIGEHITWTVKTNTPKKDLREAVKEQIRLHPEQFDMGSWDCGTTACIAGWAARLGGYRFESKSAEFSGDDEDRMLRAKREMGFDDVAVFGVLKWPRFLQLAYICSPVEAACRAIDYYAVED